MLLSGRIQTWSILNLDALKGVIFLTSLILPMNYKQFVFVSVVFLAALLNSGAAARDATVLVVPLSDFFGENKDSTLDKLSRARRVSADLPIAVVVKTNSPIGQLCQAIGYIEKLGFKKVYFRLSDGTNYEVRKSPYSVIVNEEDQPEPPPDK